jgi:acetamidase/formamidase
MTTPATRNGAGKTYPMPSGEIHHRWDNLLPPALTIESGDTVEYELLAAGEGQIQEGASFGDTRFDWDTIYNLNGPLLIADAEPGDSLEIEILELDPGPWGWSVILPGLGLLADEFDEPYVRTWDLRGGVSTELAPGVRVPIAPFLGVMGTHPSEPRIASPFPPHQGGGNIDNRHLTAGTRLWLPVHCRGALFSCGDPHAAQGDGEVCLSAIECAMHAVLRFTVHKKTIAAPRFQTPGRIPEKGGEHGYRATMGIAPDLMEGSRIAVRSMVEWLVAEHALSRNDAYILCSVAGDLKIHECVDEGVWNVGFALPESLFMATVE